MTAALKLVPDEKPAKIVPTRRSAVLKPLRGIDTYNSHPAVGLTADMLIGFFREAERGVPVRQYDCFDDMIEVDGHLRGLVGGRIESVAGCDMIVKPGRADKASEIAAGAFYDRMTNDVGLVELVEHHLTAPHYGLAITNTVWDVVEGLVAPVEFIHAAHRRFASPSAERAHEIMLIGGDTMRDLIPLEWGLWCVSRYRNRNPWAAGLMRTAAWWAMFKRWSVRDWQVFAEMFGLPLAIGYYEDGAGETSRMALEDAVRSIGEDGYAVLSAMTEVVIKDTARSGDSSTVYPQIAKLCEEQMSKLIAGGTLSTDASGNGSYALGAVHESRAYSLARADARRVEKMVKRDLGIPFIRWNGFDRAAPPELKIQITRDSLERAKALQIIGQVVPLDEAQLQEEFSLRKPAGPGVKFQAAGPAKGPPGED